MKIFGREIALRTHYCALNGERALKIDKPYVNMYVRITNTCNAHCRFCEYHDNAPGFNFDFDRFKAAVEGLAEKLEIRKISFTGGEPTLAPGALIKCTEFITKTLPATFVVVNTNGCNHKVLDDISVNSISLSRHHYKDRTNSMVFGTPSISANTINKMRNKGKIHLSCNLIRGVIDSKWEIINYLEFANAIEVRDIGFVSLMNINDFCRKRFVDFKALNIEGETLICNKKWNQKDTCRCRNYLYLPKTGNKPIKIYSRFAVKHTQCLDSIVAFDGNNLRQGFAGNILF